MQRNMASLKKRPSSVVLRAKRDAILRDLMDCRMGVAKILGETGPKRLVRYFVSYAHTDHKCVEELIGHLQANFKISKRFAYQKWIDRDLLVGGEWRVQIQKAIAQADFGLILVSTNFLASDFVRTAELPVLLNSKLSIPVALMPVDYENHDLGGIESLQMFFYHSPDNNRWLPYTKCSSGYDFALELFRQIERTLLDHFSRVDASNEAGRLEREQRRQAEEARRKEETRKAEERKSLEKIEELREASTTQELCQAPEVPEAPRPLARIDSHTQRSLYPMRVLLLATIIGACWILGYCVNRPDRAPMQSGSIPEYVTQQLRPEAKPEGAFWVSGNFSHSSENLGAVTLFENVAWDGKLESYGNTTYIVVHDAEDKSIYEKLDNSPMPGRGYKYVKSRYDSYAGKKRLIIELREVGRILPNT